MIERGNLFYRGGEEISFSLLKHWISEVTFSDQSLTPHEQPGLLGRECVLAGKVTGRDLALPETVVQDQGGMFDQQGAIAAATARQLVFLRMHSHRCPVLLPDALAPPVPYHATQLHIVTGRHFLISRRLLDELLLADDRVAPDTRDEKQDRQVDNRAIERHFCDSAQDFRATNVRSKHLRQIYWKKDSGNGFLFCEDYRKMFDLRISGAKKLGILDESWIRAS